MHMLGKLTRQPRCSFLCCSQIVPQNGLVVSCVNNPLRILIAAFGKTRNLLRPPLLLTFEHALYIRTFLLPPQSPSHTKSLFSILSSMFAWSKLSYKPLRSDERIEHSLSHKSASSIFWPACSAVLLAICLILSVRLQKNSRCDGGSESQFISWKTDFSMTPRHMHCIIQHLLIRCRAGCPCYSISSSSIRRHRIVRRFVQNHRRRQYSPLCRYFVR